MSNEESKTFWDVVSAFFKSISLKVKLIVGALIGVFGFISVFLLKRNMNSRQILELELKKLREEIEIERAKEEIEKNNEKLKTLEDRAEEIKSNIEELDNFEPRDKVSKEELDKFFDDRGF